MPDSHNNPGKPLTAVVSIIGFISSIAGIAFVPAFRGKELLLYSLVAATLVAGIWSLTRALRRKPPLRVRGHLDRGQFDVSFALGEHVYARIKKPYPTRVQAEGWRTSYADGVFQAYDRNDRCWGYFSLWPLREEAFQQLISGAIGEADLTGAMVAPAKDAPFTHWYIADILKSDACFHRNVARPIFADYICTLMIHGTLSGLLVEGQLRFPFQLIALAVSRPGEAWLRKYHFQHVKRSVDKNGAHNVYIRTMSKEALRELLGELKARIREHESEINRLVGE